MDFKNLNSRANAESGTRMQLVHEWTREPLDGAFVIVRGTAAPTIQSAQRAARQERMKANKAGKIDISEKSMGDIHDEMVDHVIPFIAGFEGVEHDGRKLTAEDAREFLNWTFPIMGDVVDANGKTVMMKWKNDDGKTIWIPKSEMKNLPYTEQIALCAKEHTNFLGNAPKG